MYIVSMAQVMYMPASHFVDVASPRLTAYQPVASLDPDWAAEDLQLAIASEREEYA